MMCRIWWEEKQHFWKSYVSHKASLHKDWRPKTKHSFSISFVLQVWWKLESLMTPHLSLEPFSHTQLFREHISWTSLAATNSVIAKRAHMRKEGVSVLLYRQQACGRRVWCLHCTLTGQLPQKHVKIRLFPAVATLGIEQLWKISRCDCRVSVWGLHERKSRNSSNQYGSGFKAPTSGYQ